MTDEEFVDAIYGAGYRRLVGQLYAVCGDLPTAEDLVQEAFVRAVAHARTFRRLDNHEAWLYRVAVNMHHSRWRRARRFLGLAPKLAEADPGHGPDLSADHVSLMAALATLPDAQREAIVLHHLADLPVHEVAATLGVPIGTVKARLSRGRAALAKVLTEQEEDRHA
jgi:RNA polymerase sigma-70 factor (ECF subfamily)